MKKSNASTARRPTIDELFVGVMTSKVDGTEKQSMSYLLHPTPYTPYRILDLWRVRA